MPRRILFTLPNPTQMEMSQILLIPQHEQFRYLIYQGEFAPTTNMPHIQGYLEITKSQRLTFFKNLIGNRAHIENVRGSSEQNIHYCTKPVQLADNTPCMCQHCTKARMALPNWLKPEVFGSPATDLTGNGFWESIYLMIQGGNENKIDERQVEKEIVEKYPQAIPSLSKIRDYQKSLKLRAIENKNVVHPEINDRKIRAIWLYGPAGSGKSHAVWNLVPREQLYSVGEGINGFDDYMNQAVILWDDFDPKIVRFKTMLRLLDVHPVQLMCRYNNKWAYYNDIFITHINKPQDVYRHYDVDKFAQILRRINVVKVEKTSTDERKFWYKNTVYQNLSDVLQQIPYRT